MQRERRTRVKKESPLIASKDSERVKRLDSRPVPACCQGLLRGLFTSLRFAKGRTRVCPEKSWASSSFFLYIHDRHAHAWAHICPRI